MGYYTIVKTHRDDSVEYISGTMDSFEELLKHVEWRMKNEQEISILFWHE